MKFDFKITNRIRLLIVVLVLVAAIAIQQPKGHYTLGQSAPVTAISAPGAYTFTAAAPSGTAGSTISLIGTGVQFHKLFAYTTGTVSACTYNLEGSTTSTFASTSNVSGTITCNSGQVPTESLVAQGKFNFVRVKLLTITGTGTVNIVYRGYNQDPSQTLTGNQVGVVSISATGTSVIVAAGTGAIHVTSIGLTLASTAATAQTVQFISGTGSCTAGITTLTGALSGATFVSTPNQTPTILAFGNGGAVLFSTALGKDLCIMTTGTQPVGGFITYRQNN